MNCLVDILDEMEHSINKNKDFARLTALEDLQKQQKGDPFKVLIGTILSSRTRDEKTSQALTKLFSKYKGSREIAEADLEDLKKAILPVGFYNIKAKRIKEVAQIINEQFQGKVPEDMKDLLNLPGVGRKTANCVLVYGFNKPAIPVDVHVHRIFNRLGIIKTKEPEETERELSKILDKKYWIRLNSIVVRYGQNICLPVNPRCSCCNLKEICKYYKEKTTEDYTI